jgi:RsiW-degrading membrane proteinase PrsW (M82 family)
VKAASYASRVARTPDDLPRPIQAPLVPRWAKVWLLTMGLGASLLLVAALNGNDTVVPAGIFLAALAGPLAFCTWVTDRTRVGRSVPPDVLLTTLLVGGGIGALFAALFNSRFFFDPTGTGVLWVGPMEEIAKLIVPLGVYVFVRKYRSVEQALAYALVSAAGFAVFESMSYGLEALELSVDDARNVLIARSVLTPFGHLPWTGLAAVVAAKAWEPDDRPHLSLMAGWGLLAAMGLHTAYNLSLVDGGWLLLTWPVVGVASFWLFWHEIRDVFYDGAYAVPAEHAVWPRWLKRDDGPWSPSRGRRIG